MTSVITHNAVSQHAFEASDCGPPLCSPSPAARLSSAELKVEVKLYYFLSLVPLIPHH